MAKYTITHSCGHEQVHQIVGPTKDRAGKAAWFERQPCTDCWRAAEKAKRDVVQAERLAGVEPELGALADLVGSEKQVAWARSIRSEALVDIVVRMPSPAKFEARVAAALESGKASPEQVAVARRAYQAGTDFVATLRGETSAKWWIDHGRGLTYEAVQAVIRKVEQAG